MDNEQRDLADVFCRPYEHGRDFWHGCVLLNDRPPRPPVSCGTCCHAGYGLYPCLRGQADAHLGQLGDLVEFSPSLVQQEWASCVLPVVAVGATPLRGYL